MNTNVLRESRHGLLQLAAAAASRCSAARLQSAPSRQCARPRRRSVADARNYQLSARLHQAAGHADHQQQDNAATRAPDIDVRDLITSITGSDLYMRDTASAAGLETNVTMPITMGKGAVRDLDVSPDGKKVVFSLRLPLDPKLKNDDPKQPTGISTNTTRPAKTVTQLTNDDITSGHDVGAHYLPDGRIVFASTRQLATQSILLDEGRPQYQAVTDNRQQFIFLLHVMNADGTDMHQISFNTNHDFAPSVLSNGQIVFSRWEWTNGGADQPVSPANPDGSGLELSMAPTATRPAPMSAGTNNNVIQFLMARQRADGKLLAIARPFLGTQLGGDIAAHRCRRVRRNQPAELADARPARDPGQAEATTLGVTTDANLPSPGGRFASLYPLYDGTNRVLVSWSPCFLPTTDGSTEVCSAQHHGHRRPANGLTLAPPQYTLWVYDFDAGTLSPLLSADAGHRDRRAGRPAGTYTGAAFIPDCNRRPIRPSRMLVNNRRRRARYQQRLRFRRHRHRQTGHRDAGQSRQASFYTRPARFIESRKRSRFPTEDRAQDQCHRRSDPPAWACAKSWAMRRSSPTDRYRSRCRRNVPFTIDVLDANARRITARHTSWLQVQPGRPSPATAATPSVQPTTPSHGRAGLTLPVNQGAPTTGQPFPGTNPAVRKCQGKPWHRPWRASAASRAARFPVLAAPHAPM